jgi:hypothetical protein
MATVLSPQESARAILSFFKLKDVRPNEMLVAGQVNQQFLTKGGNAADYVEGIKYVIERGWLEPLTNDRFRLTETGFIEMGRRRAALGGDRLPAGDHGAGRATSPG